MRYFIDMDGTLCHWKTNASDEELMQQGFFLTMNPMERVIQAVRLLIQDGNDVYILSKYMTESFYALSEKNTWLDKYLPECDKEHRIFCPYNEPKFSLVPDGLRGDDILIDDYSPNLFEWEAHGGKALKIMNGLNGTKMTWQGAKIFGTDAPEKIKKDVLGI